MIAYSSASRKSISTPASSIFTLSSTFATSGPPPLLVTGYRYRMAKAFSNIIMKGIAGLPATRSSRIVSGSFYHQALNFSTTVPSDPDTHEDFKPTNKVESSGMCLKDVVEQDVKENPVMVYMKGVPDFPQCGFSAAAVRVLKHYNAPLSARNILEDPELKMAVKSFSNWPTFPQIFIKGEFIGGSDIIMDMHRNGELKQKLEDIAAYHKSG